MAVEPSLDQDMISGSDFLNEYEGLMLAICASVDQALLAGFSRAGMRSERLSSMG